MKHIIFDGSNILWRAHWVSTQYASGYEHQDVSVVLHMVHNICNSMNCFNIAFAWDDRELRHEVNPRMKMQESYKQNRTKQNHVYEHVDIVKQLISLLGGNHYRPYALEGDDVIAVLCKQLPGEKIIVTADQDLAQLISPSVSMYSVTKKTLITHENFTEHFPVCPEHYVTYKCIIGDKSDNIPGVPKHGPKKAVMLAKMYHEQPDQIQSDVLQIIENNRKVLDLNVLITEQEIKFINDQIRLNEPDINAFRDVLQQYNLQKALQMDWLNFFLTLK